MNGLLLTLVLLHGCDANPQDIAVNPEYAQLMNQPAYLADTPLHRIFEPSKLADQLTLWSNVADGLSTLHARIVLKDRFTEANRVMDNPYRFIAMKVGVTAAVSLLSHKLRRDGHNKLANLAQYSGVALAGSFTVLNERMIYRMRTIRRQQ